MKELANLLERTDLELVSKSVLEDFDRFYDHVIEVNQAMNLTSLTEREVFAEKHLLDSLYLLPYLKGKAILDLGSGLGVPGLVLKMADSSLKLSLMDALKKRVDYLNTLVEGFKLKDTKAIHGRFEDLGHEEAYRERFDTVVARAVAGLPVLLEYALPFVKEGGYFIAMKGKNVSEELEVSHKSLEALGGRLSDEIYYNLPSGDERALIIVEKIGKTPKNYPRKPHIIKKKPL